MISYSSALFVQPHGIFSAQMIYGHETVFGFSFPRKFDANRSRAHYDSDEMNKVCDA